VNYQQCLLQNDTSRQVAFIPETLAIEGQRLKLKTATGWEEGWTVCRVWQQFNAAGMLALRNAKRHRKASDI
jgi:hypothetical protein